MDELDLIRQPFELFEKSRKNKEFNNVESFREIKRKSSDVKINGNMTSRYDINLPHEFKENEEAILNATGSIVIIDKVYSIPIGGIFRIKIRKGAKKEVVPHYHLSKLINLKT